MVDVGFKPSKVGPYQLYMGLYIPYKQPSYLFMFGHLWGLQLHF